jgi:hypothetical protein
MSKKLNQDLLKMADVICPNQTEVILINLFKVLILFFHRQKFYVILMLKQLMMLKKHVKHY